MEFEAVIGLEVHAELQTQSKMFCSCPVVDSTQSPANVAVCPVCAGLPGVLPVVNQQAVELGIRVALALDCEVAQTSIFARKNYFYPDLPKGYQISQYEYPLAERGRLTIQANGVERDIRIRRVHLEEDTGKLTHVHRDDEIFSLVDLNRAGVPLLEIVSEPDMHTVEEVRSYAANLRELLRYLNVNSGDMEKGVIRFEANVSIRPVGTSTLGTRTEIKNLNSFRALERSITYEIQRQTGLISQGEKVLQETVGWNETEGVTFSQRSKEEAHDYRYFPEPDLPPLVVEEDWIERVRAGLPELPRAKRARFQAEYELSSYDANLLVSEAAIADYFEQATAAAGDKVSAKNIANWMLTDLFGLMNLAGTSITEIKITPQMLTDLLKQVSEGVINQSTAKSVLSEMFETGKSASEIIKTSRLEQISDSEIISNMIRQVLEQNPIEVAGYLGGKETLAQWFFGQVMRSARGQANPQVIRAELERQLAALRSESQ